MARHFTFKRLAAVPIGVMVATLVLGTCAATASNGSPARRAASPAASTDYTALQAPAIPGVGQLPGPVAKAASPSSNMGILQVTPDQAVAGTLITISGSQLPANKKVELTWSTADATWLVQTEPDTVNYLGRSDTEFAVVLDTTTTNSSGAFKVSLKAPQDWGGLHDIYAVINGVEEAHGGFITLRTVTVTPRSGPVGTPITITYSGLGDSLYTGGASLLWDNHYVGELMANWTRGVARVTIRAAGPVGEHTIQIGNAISYLYLNVPQSPIPYTNGATVGFTVTKDDGPPPSSIDWPVDVAPTVSARTTLQTSGLAPNTSAKAQLATTSGPVDTPRQPDSLGAHLECSGAVGLVDRGRQPGQLQEHVLGLCVPVVGSCVRLGRIGQLDDHGSRRPRGLARGPACPRRQDRGAGALLCEREHRR